MHAYTSPLRHHTSVRTCGPYKMPTCENESIFAVERFRAHRPTPSSLLGSNWPFRGMRTSTSDALPLTLGHFQHDQPQKLCQWSERITCTVKHKVCFVTILHLIYHGMRTSKYDAVPNPDSFLNSSSVSNSSDRQSTFHMACEPDNKFASMRAFHLCLRRNFSSDGMSPWLEICKFHN